MILYFINLCILCTLPTSTLQKEPTCVIGSNHGRPVQYVCCAEEYLDKTTCLECPIGTTSKLGSKNISDCVICQSPFYGIRCVEECVCNATETCDNVRGCIPNTTETETTTTSKTTTTYINKYVDQAEWMMIFSSSVIVLCLVIVMAVFLSKCCSRMRPNEAHTIKQMSKKDKEKQERKKNVYGTYEKKSITTDDDEFEFDTDNDDEDEDAYAMIRESQVFTTDVNTDKLDGNCIEYNKYNTGYNHLHLMRAQPSNQKQTRNTNYSHAIYGKQFLNFQT